MKKLLLLIFISIAFLSCKKDCWNCHIAGTFNGVTYDEHKIYCGDDPANADFTDAEGNDLNYSCEP